MATKKKRRQMAVTDDGIRYLLMAAIGDFPQLRGRTVNQSIAWLAKYAMGSLYLSEVSFGHYLAQKIIDESYPWASADDPLAAMAEAALLEPQLVESVLFGRAKPTMEFISAIAGVLDEDVETLLALAAVDNLGERVDVRVAVR